MPDWTEVTLTSACTTAPTDGQILLPTTSTLPSGRRTLVEGNDKSKLMKSGLRSDPGTAACVNGTTLAAFGGNGATVKYRGVSFFGLLRRDRWLAAQFATSILTVIGALITGYLTFEKNSGSDASPFASGTALIALAIAAVIAVLKFVKEFREL